jgi:Predicted transcriptional regulator
MSNPENDDTTFDYPRKPKEERSLISCSGLSCQTKAAGTLRQCPKYQWIIAAALAVTPKVIWPPRYCHGQN